MASIDLLTGDGVWIDHHGTHPGVVMDVEGGRAVVIVGSSKGRPHYAEVCIQPKSHAATALGLTKPTYFNATRVAIISDTSSIKNKTRRCPPQVFNQLLALVERRVAGAGTENEE